MVPQGIIVMELNWKVSKIFQNFLFISVANILSNEVHRLGLVIKMIDWLAIISENYSNE